MPVAVTPTCTLSSTMDVICNDDGSVSVNVNITGDDTYDIIGTNSGFVFAEGVGEGEIILGPFNNS